jgi:N-acyl-D-amino-acid deacylase
MPDFDMLIRGGTVVDGTRRPRRQCDVAITDGRIVELGRFAGHTARRVIDAGGSIVAPGAIDLHTHYDAQIHWDPYCTMASWHGVTTVTLGNCGFGLAPVRGRDAERALLTLSRNEAIPLSTLRAAIEFSWETFPQWLDHVARLPLGVNVAQLVPLSPLVGYACDGFDAAKVPGLPERNQAQVTRLLGEALDAGAVGWSAQRTPPGSLVAFQRDFDGSPMVTDVMSDELYLALAATLHDVPGAFVQFAQSTATPEDMLGDMQRDFAFTARLAALGNRPVLYNGIAPGEEMPGIFRAQLAWVADANARGVPVFAQGATVRAPVVLTFEDWNLFDASPIWREATLGSVAERKAKLADPEIRGRLKAEYDSGRAPLGFFGPLARYALHGTSCPVAQPLVGLELRAIAARLGRHPVDALLDISLAEDLRTEWISPLINENAAYVAELLDSPYTIPGSSDGGAHVKFLTAAIYPTDLLVWLVREAGSLTLEEAHYRLSALPASIAGLCDRGRLVPGSSADVVIYDLDELAIGAIERVDDLPAGEWRRIRKAQGYRHVIVNGESIFVDGRCTGLTPGRLIRRAG